MDRRLEALDMRRGWCGGAHAISAPPPNEKTLRKKDEAANAMLSPNTIWLSRRNPHAVSPNARVRPVTVDRKTVESGTSVSVRVDLGGCRILKHNNQTHIIYSPTFICL